jgi:guanine deaminase
LHSLRARVLSPISPDAIAWLDDAVVVIDRGRIHAVRPGGPADEDLRPGVLMPGWVDSHIHYPQTRIVGAASGPLLEWLARSTFPEEARFADPAHARAVAEVFATRLAAAGTTLAFVYGPVFPAATDVLLEVLDRRGMRAIAGPVLMDEHCPEALRIGADDALAGVDALAERWHGHDGRLEVAVIPRFALSCSAEIMRGAASLARGRGLWASTHLAENPEECRVARQRFDRGDYLAVYEDAGLVGPRSVFAHCVHLSAGEWDRFEAAGAVVAHCPDSNAFLGSGHLPIAEPMKRTIPMTVGTDVAGGRTFRIPRVLSSAYDNGLATGVSLDPRTLLWWGTRGGAAALGHPEVGAIEPGLEADLVLVDVPEWSATAEQVLASVLFDTDSPLPRRTWVRGRVVWDREA